MKKIDAETRVWKFTNRPHHSYSCADARALYHSYNRRKSSGALRQQYFCILHGCQK